MKFVALESQLDFVCTDSPKSKWRFHIFSPKIRLHDQMIDFGSTNCLSSLPRKEVKISLSKFGFFFSHVNDNEWKNDVPFCRVIRKLLIYSTHLQIKVEINNFFSFPCCQKYDHDFYRKFNIFSSNECKIY